MTEPKSVLKAKKVCEDARGKSAEYPEGPSMGLSRFPLVNRRRQQR